MKDYSKDLNFDKSNYITGYHIENGYFFVKYADGSVEKIIFNESNYSNLMKVMNNQIDKDDIRKLENMINVELGYNKEIFIKFLGGLSFLFLVLFLLTNFFMLPLVFFIISTLGIGIGVIYRLKLKKELSEVKKVKLCIKDSDVINDELDLIVNNISLDKSLESKIVKSKSNGITKAIDLSSIDNYSLSELKALRDYAYRIIDNDFEYEDVKTLKKKM